MASSGTLTPCALTPVQSDYFAACDANPHLTPHEIRRSLDIDSAEFGRWNSGADNRAFQEEARRRDNARRSGKEKTPAAKAAPVVYVARPVPQPLPGEDRASVDAPLPAVAETQVAAPVAEPVPVADVPRHVGKGPRDSLARVLGPYLTYEKYSNDFMQALRENGGDFAKARDVTKTPDDVFNGWLHVPAINAKINEAAAAAGSNETLRTFQAKLNAEYMEKRDQKKRQSAHPGR